MSESTHREVAVLNTALELPPSERAAYLDQACAGDAALRKQVDALLHANEQAEGFLEAPPAGLDFQRTARVNIPLTEKPGDRIGRYKLLQQIGEGGCGVVYMAEQEEPVRRRVALKVIKLGMDTKQVVARFEAERQALALMDHPNIAKVFDAGTTETGRPYFVMELVRGIKITDYCDEHNVSTEERLKLFMQVCQAIQHAHQKGIIHRDIKPSNILVTVNDDVPVPKVIDFGIAKATQGRLTDQTLFTAFEQFMGTPAYMSPEQAVMTSLDIDTRTDIYSLGVLLYELLTGKTPFDASELLAAGLDEMRRTIRECEPSRPSTRLSTMHDGELSTAAKHRHTDAPKLIHLVRGDLDWIVMKCLEKDRTRRYETANGLTLDLHRHLDNEPIVARPPSQLYRLGKSVRRNKLVFASAGIIAVLLVGGVAISTWQAVRATRAERGETRLRKEAEHARSQESAHRKRAESEKTRSEEVAKFLMEMLEGVGPAVARGRDTQMLREILDRTADRIAGLGNQPQVVAEIRSTLGTTYLKLGDFRKAEAMQREALRLRERQFGETNQLTARTMTDLSRALVSLKPIEAETLARRAIAIWPHLKDGEPADAALSHYVLASALVWQQRLPEAESIFRRVVEMRKALYGPEHVEVAMTLDNLGLALQNQNKFREAETNLLEALGMQEKLLGHEHPDVANTLQLLAFCYVNEGRLTDAEAACRTAAELRWKLLPHEHTHVTQSISYEATILSRLGRRDEAKDWFEKVLAVGDAHALNSAAWFLATTDVVNARDGNLAIQLAGKAVSLTRRRHTYYLDTLGAAYAEAGQFEKAVSVQKEAMALVTEEEKKRGRYEDRLKLYQSNTPYRENK